MVPADFLVWRGKYMQFSNIYFCPVSEKLGARPDCGSYWTSEFSRAALINK